MTPWEVLTDRIIAAGYAGNVYPAPVTNISPPAIVIRPGLPWLSVTDAPSYCASRQRYVVTAVVTASTPSDGVGELLSALGNIAAAAQGSGWAFVDAGPPIIDETTGTPLLAAAANVTYDTEDLP